MTVGTMNSSTKAKRWQYALPMIWFSLRFSSSLRQSMSSTPLRLLGRKRFERSKRRPLRTSSSCQATFFEFSRTFRNV